MRGAREAVNEIVSEKSGEDLLRHAPFSEREELLEFGEDYQRDDEPPEDHCRGAESYARPLRHYTKLSHSR